MDITFILNHNHRNSCSSNDGVFWPPFEAGKHSGRFRLAEREKEEVPRAARAASSPPGIFTGIGTWEDEMRRFLNVFIKQTSKNNQKTTMKLSQNLKI